MGSEMCIRDRYMKKAVPILFEYDDFVPKIQDCVNPQTTNLEHRDLILRRFQGKDNSKQFSNLGITIFGDDSFLPIETIDKITDGKKVEVKSVIAKLGDDPLKHLKFSGWSITHISLAAAKILLEENDGKNELA